MTQTRTSPPPNRIYEPHTFRRDPRRLSQDLQGSDPKHSGLLLALNDIVTTEELAGLELNADFVTLGGCRTGLNQQRPGDELIGLTRALVNAGTASIIVCLWAVDDLSTAILMQHFTRL